MSDNFLKHPKNIEDYDTNSTYSYGACQILTSGRTKQKIRLLVFQDSRTYGIVDYTNNCSAMDPHQDLGLQIVIFAAALPHPPCSTSGISKSQIRFICMVLFVNINSNIKCRQTFLSILIPFHYRINKKTNSYQRRRR
jgi:hypothetical protein